MGHDQAFKDLLQAFLPEFVSLFFPQEARQIDWSDIEFVDKELFTDLLEGSRRTLDLLARVHTVEGQPELIFIHVEVEADPRVEFPQRMYEYYTLLRRRRRAPVLPIAVYLAPGHGGVTWQSYEEHLFEHRLLEFRFRTVSIPDLQEGALAKANPLTYALMPLLEDAGSDPVEMTLGAYAGIASTASDAARQALLVGFFHNYIRLTPEETVEVERRLEDNDYAEVRAMLTIWHERGRAQGRAEGKAEGKAEGRAEGKAEGRAEGIRSSVISILDSRFGGTSQELLSRLKHVEQEAELDRLLRFALTTPSLDDFLRQVPVPKH